MTFAILDRYRGGEITQPDMLEEIEQLLADEKADRSSMIEIMEDDAAATELPRSLEIRLRARINGASVSEVTQRDLDESSLIQLEAKYGNPTAEDSETTLADSAHDDAAEEIDIGATLNNRFKLLQLLGRGGMSLVFKAQDTVSYGSPIVAVKVLNRSFSNHPDSQLVLKREVAKSQQLAHPNIVNVRDFGVDGQHAYMWMEYLNGLSLADRLDQVRSEGLPREEAQQYLGGIAEALRYAHDHSIVHSDFKPGNVMITHDPVDNQPQAKIIDFGISRAARPLDAPGGDYTIFDPGVLKAITPSYASLEMLERRHPDPRDDIYALACIVYEMFTGSHPFSRMSAIDARAERKKPAPNRKLTSVEFKALRHGLAFEREERTPSVVQFLEEFRKPRLSAKIVVLGLGVTAAAGLAAAISMTNLVPATGGPSLIRDCPTCPELVVVQPGTFEQGTPAQSPGHLENEGPVRLVVIPRPFAIGRFEVTVGEFAAFAQEQGELENSGCLVYTDDWSLDMEASWENPGFEQATEHPVTCVSWYDAQDYVAWLSKISGHPYRLPSASEWEYVAQQPPDTGFFSWGNTDLCSVANLPDETAGELYVGWEIAACADGVVHTAPAGSLTPNEAGAFDILGNVFEWVQDCWNDSYRDAPNDGRAWLEGNCLQRELRGGSWHSRPEVVRAAFRNRLPGNTRSSSIGFRVVREL